MSAESDLEKAEPVDLKKSVEYSAGAVVSKTLVNRKTGTITLFAFDAGQGLSEHTAPFDAVAQILEGEAGIAIGGKSLTVSAGQMVIMPAHVPHAVQAIQKFKMLLTMIRS